MIQRCALRACASMAIIIDLCEYARRAETAGVYGARACAPFIYAHDIITSIFPEQNITCLHIIRRRQHMASRRQHGVCEYSSGAHYWFGDTHI